MSEGTNDWNEVDPRVKWCMDLLDWEGAEPNTLYSYYVPPIFGALMGAGLNIFRNVTGRNSPIVAWTRFLTGQETIFLLRGLGLSNETVA
jgi:hypothetical protein